MSESDMPIRMSERGLFIVIEGVDGTGKTTLAGGIRSRLIGMGMDCVTTAEPTDGPVGRLLRKGVTDNPKAEALLFVSDRAMHTDAMRERIEKGETVVCDRYYASTLAYQAASGTGVDESWLRSLNDQVIMKPDFVFLLDADPELCSARIDRRGEERSRFEHLEYQRLVRENYLRIAKEDGFTVIDASKGQEAVLDEVFSQIRRRIEGE